jgi:hypothetical protein
VHQPAPANKDGLDPLKAVPRLAQIYDPATAMVFIIDFRTVPVSVLKALEHRQLIIHNSTFEHSMLLPQGIRLRRTWDTLQPEFPICRFLNENHEAVRRIKQASGGPGRAARRLTAAF